jgi:uncharacterized 2Fe-2S/4Fe-4S cluster protein (DUF4445 family)
LGPEASRAAPAGNTSLRGLKMALLSPTRRDGWIAGVRSRTEHIGLASDPQFQELFAECMSFW